MTVGKYVCMLESKRETNVIKTKSTIILYNITAVRTRSRVVIIIYNYPRDYIHIYFIFDRYYNISYLLLRLKSICTEKTGMRCKSPSRAPTGSIVQKRFFLL